MQSEYIEGDLSEPLVLGHPLNLRRFPKGHVSGPHPKKNPLFFKDDDGARRHIRDPHPPEPETIQAMEQILEHARG